MGFPEGDAGMTAMTGQVVIILSEAEMMAETQLVLPRW